MSTTKLLKWLIQFEKKNKKRIHFFENHFALSIFFLFLGFVCGNLFGTFLTFFRNFANWDGTIIISTIVFIEFINYLNYTTNGTNKPIQWLSKSKLNLNFILLTKFDYLKQTVFLFLNFYKIGLLLGFFTDAFKVGS